MGRNKTKRRQVPIKEALEQFTQDEAAKLIDQDAVNKEAIARAENSGIVFLTRLINRKARWTSRRRSIARRRSARHLTDR